jgi:hypothetical protein
MRARGCMCLLHVYKYECVCVCVCECVCVVYEHSSRCYYRRAILTTFARVVHGYKSVCMCMLCPLMVIWLGLGLPCS